MKNQTRNSALLVLAALLWGVAFVAQSEGGTAVGPYSFNCIRCFIGAAVLCPVFLLLDRFKLSAGKPQTKTQKKNLWQGGIACGVILFFATNLQQVGLVMGTSPGKAGFMTACYIVLVPIIGLFFKKKCSWLIGISVVLTVIGLYLLCINESLTFCTSDILVIICAFAFSAHILVVDRFSPLVDGVRMSCIQFLVCGTLTAIPMLFFEMRNGSGGFSAWLEPFSSANAWISVLYTGIFSSGVAYTLQIVGQKGVNPTVASLLMSLESVFSALAGWLILGQAMTLKELSGCALIFIAVILAQLPVRKKKESI